MQFILRHERRHGLRFAALDSDAGRAVRARHPQIAGVDSMVWVDHPGRPAERVVVRSAAALRIARYMGGIWQVAALFTLVPRALRDAGYDLIARHRRRLVRSGDRCYIPSPAVRQRFLDQTS